MLIVRDDKSKTISGRVAPQKGIDEKGVAVSSLDEDVRWLGYSNRILKSDNEPAIVKLLREALREVRIEGAASAPVLMEEHSPEFDP